MRTHYSSDSIRELEGELDTNRAGRIDDIGDCVGDAPDGAQTLTAERLPS